MFLTIFSSLVGDRQPFQLHDFAQNISVRLDVEKANLHYLVDILLVVWNLDFQVVARKARHHTATHRTLEEHLCRSAEIALTEIVVTTAAQLLQTLGSRHRNLWRHLIGKVYRRGILTLGVWEDVQERRFNLRQEVVTLLELRLALARKTGDYIYTDKGIRHRSTHRIYALLELLDSIAATHQTEHLVRAALNRNMEVMLKFR